jgi:hypothetical protein
MVNRHKSPSFIFCRLFRATAFRTPPSGARGERWRAHEELLGVYYRFTKQRSPGDLTLFYHSSCKFHGPEWIGNQLACGEEIHFIPSS